MKIKLAHLLEYIGGNTNIIIRDYLNSENNLEIWRGKVDELDWSNLPCGDNYIHHITVIEGEEWLQILV